MSDVLAKAFQNMLMHFKVHKRYYLSSLRKIQ